MTIKTFLFIIMHEIFATFEQILFKKSADNHQTHGLRGIKSYFLYIIKIFKMPAIWLAFLMIIASWATWFIVLAETDLSIAIPVDSLQYIMILLVSYFFLGERMHWTRILGTIFILLGVFFVAKS